MFCSISFAARPANLLPGGRTPTRASLRINGNVATVVGQDNQPIWREVFDRRSGKPLGGWSME
jgi:hypothetical protein